MSAQFLKANFLNFQGFKTFKIQFNELLFIYHVPDLQAKCDHGSGRYKSYLDISNSLGYFKFHSQEKLVEKHVMYLKLKLVRSN